MPGENSSIISHVSIGTRDMANALVFYDAIMATIGAERQAEIAHSGKHLVAVAYGKQSPEFWIVTPENERPAESGNGVHIAFSVDNRESIDHFHAVALENGGTNNGAPGPRPKYGEQYYGCFIFDLDRNKLEACFQDASLAIQGIKAPQLW